MPHTRSAKKRLRQSTKRRLRNRSVIKDIKTQMKAVHSAAQGGNVEILRTEARTAIRRLDKAGARGTVHPNSVARKKSQIARLLRSKETGAKKA